MTRRVTCLSILISLFASAAMAQTIGRPVASDLNGDGRAERFALIDSGNGTVDLQIEYTGRGAIYAQNIAWLGGIGQQPELSLAPNGSVRLMSMNEAIGRNRWHLTLTIAYRKGAYRIAGYTYDWYDTLNPEDNGVCDLNLLNGKGTLSRNGGASRAIRTTLKSRSVTEWTDDVEIPKVCGVY